MQGFTIKCDNCGKEFKVGSKECYENILFYIDREYDRNIIEISCNCGNEIKEV